MAEIKWTKEEIILLENLSSKYTYKTIARRLKYPLSEIENKAAELNLTNNIKVKEWPEWKIDYLKENIKTTSLQNIMETLNVNYYELINQISELELEYNNRYWAPEEEQILRELCPKIYIKYVADILGKTQKAVTKRAKKLGVSYITLQRVYTEEELNYIKDNWKIIPVSDMARKLKVSRIMIQAQADKMNLPPLGNNPYRRWTKEKVEELRELAKTKTSEEIADYFGCTQSSIVTAASDNNIKLINSNHWTEEELNKLKELAKTKTIDEIAISLNKTAGAIRRIAKRNNIALISTPVKKKKYWTEEEFNQLRYLLIDEKKSVEEIAKILDRTQDAIVVKINRLGLQTQGSKRTWKLQEEKLLRSLWGKESIESIAQKLNRTPSSINNKAFLLNLGSQIENSEGLTVAEISEMLNVSREVVNINWISLGLKVHEQKLSKNTSCKYVKKQDLLDFLEANQNIWDSKNLEEDILGEEPEWLKEKRKKDIEHDFKLEQINIVRQQLYMEKQALLSTEEQQEVLKRKR